MNTRNGCLLLRAQKTQQIMLMNIAEARFVAAAVVRCIVKASVGVGKADEFVTKQKFFGDWLVKSSGDGTRYAGCNLENNLFASEDLGVVEFMSLKPPGESVTMKVTRSLPGSRAATASIAVDDDFHITVEGKYRGDVETNYLIDTNKANQLLDAIAGAAKSSKRTRITFDGTVSTLPLSGFEEALAQFKACLGK